MQTLNVGAGRTDEEYKATEEQRRADLRSDCRDDANYFFWAAGLSALGTGLLPVRLNLLVSVGTVDLLTLYGRPLGPFYPLAGCGKSLNRDDSPPQGLKPSLILHDLRGAKAPLYHSAAGFRDFFRSLLNRWQGRPLVRNWPNSSGRLGSREPVFYSITSQIWPVDFSYRPAGLLDRFRRHPG